MVSDEGQWSETRTNRPVRRRRNDPRRPSGTHVRDIMRVHEVSVPLERDLPRLERPVIIVVSSVLSLNT